MPLTATEGALLRLSGPIFHDLDVPIGLTGEHDPAAREIGQHRDFGFVMRQGFPTTAFFGLSSAMLCAVHIHCQFFCVTATPPRIYRNAGFGRKCGYKVRRSAARAFDSADQESRNVSK